MKQGSLVLRPFGFMLQNPLMFVPLLLLAALDIVVLLLTVPLQIHEYDPASTMLYKVVLIIVVGILTFVASILPLSWFITLLRQGLTGKPLDLGLAWKDVWRSAWALLRFQLWALLFFALVMIPVYLLAVIFIGLSAIWSWLELGLVLVLIAGLILVFSFIVVLLQSIPFLVLSDMKPLHMFRAGWRFVQVHKWYSAFILLVFAVVYLITMIPQGGAFVHSWLIGESFETMQMYAEIHPVSSYFVSLFMAWLMLLLTAYIAVLTCMGTLERRKEL